LKETIKTIRVSGVYNMTNGNSTKRPGGGCAEAAVIAAARGLFFEYGFSRVKMEDIASRCGISKKTLYVYFSDKEELFERALLSILDEWKGKYAEVSAHGGGCGERFRRLNDFVLECYSMISRPLAADMRRFAPEAFKKVDSWREGIIFSDISALLDQAVKQGLFEKDMDPRLVLVLYHEFARNVLTPDFMARYPYTPAQARETLNRIFFGRLLTKKGSKVLGGSV